MVVFLGISSVLTALLLALLVASTASGEVRTTVAVSLRGTAFLAASAAACGVTPIDVVGWLAALLGMVAVPAVPLVCATAVRLLATNTVARKSLLVVKYVMMNVSPTKLKNTSVQIEGLALHLKMATGMRRTLQQVACTHRVKNAQS